MKRADVFHSLRERPDRRLGPVLHSDLFEDGLEVDLDGDVGDLEVMEIVRSNRQGGPERVLDVVAERAPDGFIRLEDVIAREELAAIVGGYVRMAGFADPANPESGGRLGIHRRG